MPELLFNPFPTLKLGTVSVFVYSVASSVTLLDSIPLDCLSAGCLGAANNLWDVRLAFSLSCVVFNASLPCRHQQGLFVFSVTPHPVILKCFVYFCNLVYFPEWINNRAWLECVVLLLRGKRLDGTSISSTYSKVQDFTCSVLSLRYFHINGLSLRPVKPENTAKCPIPSS